MEKILEGEFDLIILDIALPSRSLTPGGGSTSSLLSGGVEIIYRLEELKRMDPVSIITQYPDIDIEEEHVPVKKIARNPSEFFDANIVGCIRYERKNDLWAQSLTQILKEFDL